IKINGKNLPMTPFVQRIIRRTILAMLSTLKGTEIQGNEIIEVTVKKASK
ncbi:molybdopterin-guanine dinucleotide biosynthesis protein MobB, partial [Candidatus Bathyarchaeota archaeon]